MRTRAGRLPDALGCGVSSGKAAPRAQTVRQPVPPRVRTHPAYVSEQKHTVEHCFTCRREEREAAVDANVRLTPFMIALQTFLGTNNLELVSIL